MSIIPRLMSQSYLASCLNHVSYVNHTLSHISIMSLMSIIPCLMSLMSIIPRLMSQSYLVSCLNHVSCLRSQLSHISNLMSQVFIISHVSIMCHVSMISRILCKYLAILIVQSCLVRFNNLCDFQYLCMEQTKEKGHKSLYPQVCAVVCLKKGFK